ncbi:hypothetical protein [Gemella morbillorum]
MRILIYGAGVIGCLYATLFSKVGFIYYWFSALYVTKKSNCETKYQRIAEREEFDKF